ncbi:inactive tyrosine-protein kinase 7 isoform X1 [Halyomorpha halys]|uniref:inactive tyrosine-protein kinase 7 isoform X1 n=1 Tax=Halyomorpha halys TaxID=286706 RepID=UPI0034D1E61A
MTCEVEGTEPISIQWFRNGDGLKTAGKIHTTGRDLIVLNVNPLDNGIYRCLATNPSGTVKSKNTDIITVPGEQWAQIVVPPEDTITKEGMNARFDCVYNFADVIEWYYKQKGPLENSTHYSVLTNGSLVVLGVTKQDEGLYSCVGIRGESTEVPQIFSAQLLLAYLKEADNQTLEPWEGSLRLVAEDSDYEIGCVGYGLPTPTVSWTRGGTGNVLKLKSVSKADQGNYTCIISNLAGTTTANVKIVVTSRPSIEQNPIPVIVDEGNDALFHCEFSGNHKYSTVTWYKDGTLVKPGSRIIDKRGFLNITQTQPSDEGDYLCVVNTKPYPPIFSSPASLTVKEKLKFAPKPVSTHLELGTPKKVHCKAHGATPPFVKWIKEGYIEGEFPSHISDINGTLHFNKVQADDKGKYTCIASNFQGIINATIDIDVVVSPKFTVLPQNPTYVSESSIVIMDCMAEGDPKPAIHWDKNSDMESFDKTRFTVLENGSLLITDVLISDEGKYGCTAGNSGGLKRYEVSLIVRGSEGYRVTDGSDSDSGTVLSKTVAVTLGAAGAYMILVIGLMAYCRCRSRRNKQASLDHPDAVCDVLIVPGDGGEGGNERKGRNGDLVVQSDGDVPNHSHASNHSSKYGNLPVTRDQLSNMMVLGRGQFGEVCLAQVTQTESVVMVKALQETRDEAVLIEFKRELDLFGRVDHPNVAKLVGLCQEQHPHYMILQYTDWGDLKQMLLASKADRKDKPKPPELTSRVLLGLVQQICLGMESLSNHRLVHKDLAARNCLVGSDLTVKVSLSALSKDVYRKEYFLHRNQLLPVRWLPYEVVSEDDYSTKSDVYSFGVTAWEIFSLGNLPHGGRSDQEVLSSLESGDNGLPLPASSPEALQSLIDKCRAKCPNDRPVFSMIALQLADIINQID